MELTRQGSYGTNSGGLIKRRQRRNNVETRFYLEPNSKYAETSIGFNSENAKRASTLSVCIPQDILQFGEQLQKTIPFVSCEVSALLAPQHA
jgi:hypothetical protein